MISNWIMWYVIYMLIALPLIIYTINYHKTKPKYHNVCDTDCERCDKIRKYIEHMNNHIY